MHTYIPKNSRSSNKNVLHRNQQTIHQTATKVNLKFDSMCADNGRAKHHIFQQFIANSSYRNFHNLTEQ